MNSGPVRENTAPAGSAPSEAPLLRLEEFLPHRLNVLSSLVSQALTRVYGRYGIGIPEWRVLVTLGENGVLTGKVVGVPSTAEFNQQDGLSADEKAFGTEPELSDQDKRALIAFLKTF